MRTVGKTITGETMAEDANDLLNSLPSAPTANDYLGALPSTEHVTPMHAARWRAQREMPEDTAGDFIARNLGHFGASMVGHTLSTRARNRIAEGRAEDGDYDIVARHERLKELAGQSESGFWGGTAAMALRAPEMVAQGMLAPGAGQGAGLGTRVAVGAATTPLNPSMWAPEAVQRAEKQGGNLLAPQNVLPALGSATIQNAIFAGAGNLGQGIENPVRAWANRAGASLLAQQGGDAAVSALDAVLPEAYKTDTKFGAVGSMIRGEYGEAAKQIGMQAVQHGAFAWLHHGDKKKAVDAVKDAVNEQMEMLKKAPPEDQAAVAKPDQSGVPQVAGQPVMETGIPGREQTGVPGYTLKEVAPKEATTQAAHDVFSKHFGESIGGEGEFVAPFGEKYIVEAKLRTTQHGPVADISFAHADKGRELSEAPPEAETTAFGKKLLEAAKDLHKQGVGVFYETEPKRAATYGRFLKRMGFEKAGSEVTTDPKGEAVHRETWMPTAEASKRAGVKAPPAAEAAPTPEEVGGAVSEKLEEIKRRRAGKKESTLAAEPVKGAAESVGRENLPADVGSANRAAEAEATGRPGEEGTGAAGRVPPGAPGAGEGGGPGEVPQGQPAELTPENKALPPEVRENLRAGLTPEEAERVHDVDARKSGGATLAEKMKAKAPKEKEPPSPLVAKEIARQQKKDAKKQKKADAQILKIATGSESGTLDDIRDKINDRRKKSGYKPLTDEQVEESLLRHVENGDLKKHRVGNRLIYTPDEPLPAKVTPQHVNEAIANHDNAVKELNNAAEEAVPDGLTHPRHRGNEASVRRETTGTVQEGIERGATPAEGGAAEGEAAQGGAARGAAPAERETAGNVLNRVAPDQANVTINGYKAKPETMEAIHRLIGGREIKYDQLLAEAEKAGIILHGRVSNGRDILTSALTQLDFEGKIQTFGSAADKGLGETIRPAPGAAGNELKKAFAAAFGEPKVEGNQLSAVVGDRKMEVSLVEGKGRPIAVIDFNEASGEGKEVGALRKGTIDLLRSLEGFVSDLGKQGLGVSYEAEPRRARIYQKALEGAGFTKDYEKNLGGESSVFQWSPPEAAGNVVEGERFLKGPPADGGRPVDDAAHDQYRKALAGNGNQPVGTIRGLLEGNESPAARELIKKAGDVPVFVSDGLPADVPARHILTQDGKSFIALNRQRPLTAKELAWALGHEGAHAARAKAGRGVAYEPGKPEEEHAFEESANRLAEAVSGRKAGERSLAGPPAGAAPAAANQPGGKPVSQFDIIATMKSLFGMPTYGGAEKDTTYDLYNESVAVPKARAGEAPLISHELAHHLEKQLQLLPALTANNLPPDVKAGLAQFDYIPNRPNALVGAREGFAEWLRRRSTGQLTGLSPEQQAASGFLEGLMASKPGVTNALDRIRDMFSQYEAQSPKEKYGGLISETGKPAEPELKPGEMAAGYAKRSLDSAVDKLVDDAMPAKRAEKAAEARGAKFAPGTKLSEVIATGRLRTAPLAIEFQQGGVHGFDQSGKQKQLGRPLAKILEGLSGEDLKDLDRFGAARRDVFDADVSKLPIPAADLQLARDTLRELGKDPQRLQRLSDVADSVRKEVYNASLDSMVMSGWKTQEWADGIKDGNPFYWPAYKIPEHEWHNPTPNFFKARKGGSGEQRVNMMDALQDRYQFLANILNKQARFAATLNLGRQPGVGQWLSPGQPGPEPDPKLGGVMAWPKDGSRPQISGMVNGENVNIPINDKAFYEMVTGTQGEGDVMHGFLKGMGNLTQAMYIPQTIRAGATALSPAWLAKSFVRDLFLYPQRTVSERNVIQNIGDYLSWSAKGVEFYGRALLAGGAENVALKYQSDIYFKLQERMTGREHGASGEKVLDGWPGFFHRLSDFFTSTEKATRVLELKNAWDKLGWTQDRINAELAKDPSQRNPIPFAEQVAGLDIASQITHNVHQQGEWVRQLNRSTPFLGAHIAGVYKDLQSFAKNPKKVTGTLMILMAAKGLEYAMNHNDEEWQSLPDHYRYGFSFKTPFGWMHIPAPRGISGVITGMMDYATRKMGDNNPNLAGFAKQAFGELAPSPVSAPIKLYGDIRSNTDTFGRPIVPHREEGTPMGYLKQGRYIAGQATGGLTERPLRIGQAIASGEAGKVGETLNPFSMHVVPKDVRDVRQFRQTYRDILDKYKGEWWDATQKGAKFKQPPELKVAEEMSGKLHKLDLAANQPSATPEQVQRYRADQAKIARSALEKIEAYQKAKR